MTQQTKKISQKTSPAPSWNDLLPVCAERSKLITQAMLLPTMLLAIIGNLVVLSFSIAIKVPIDMTTQPFVVIGMLAVFYVSLMFAYPLVCLQQFSSRKWLKLGKPFKWQIFIYYYVLPTLLILIATAVWNSSGYILGWVIPIIPVIYFRFIIPSRYYLINRKKVFSRSEIVENIKPASLYNAIKHCRIDVKRTGLLRICWRYLGRAITFLLIAEYSALALILYAVQIDALLGLDVQIGWEVWLLFFSAYVFMTLLVLIGLIALRGKKSLKTIALVIFAVLLISIILGGKNLGASALTVLGQGGGIVRNFWIQDAHYGMSERQLTALNLKREQITVRQQLKFCLWASDRDSWYVSVVTTERRLGERCAIQRGVIYQNGIVAINKKLLVPD